MASRDQKLEMLRRVPLFARLSPRQIQRIGALADEVDVPDGKVLTREGASGQEFFVLVDGQARVERAGKLVGKLSPGDFFGEISLIDGGPRTATVQAEGAARLLVLNRPQFLSLLREFQDIHIEILEALAHRVRQLLPEALH